MLNSLFSNTSSSIEFSSILICSIVSIILGIAIAFTHMKVTRSNKNFLTTLVILPLLVQTIIMMVNGNLGTSIATLGAFGLVRFRSLPGTSIEILSVFFAMTVGLATGMGYVTFAALITLFTILSIFLIQKIHYFDNSQERILSIIVPEDLDYTTMFQDVFEKYMKSVTLERVKTTNMGSLFDLHYRIVLNKDINEKELIDALRIRNGNLKVALTHSIDTTEM